MAQKLRLESSLVLESTFLLITPNYYLLFSLFLLGCIFSISDQRVGLLVGGTTSGLVFLGSIREQAEQARGSNPVSNIPSWPPA